MLKDIKGHCVNVRCLSRFLQETDGKLIMSGLRELTRDSQQQKVITTPSPEGAGKEWCYEYQQERGCLVGCGLQQRSILSARPEPGRRVARGANALTSLSFHPPMPLPDPAGKSGRSMCYGSQITEFQGPHQEREWEEWIWRGKWRLSSTLAI